MPPDKTARRLVLLFGVIATLLVAVAVVALRNLHRELAANDWVNRTHATMLELGEIAAAFHASDAALHTLGSEGHEQVVAACRESLARLAEHVAIAQALLRSDTASAPAVARLATLATARHTLTQNVLAAHSANQAAQVAALLAADTATGATAEVRRLVEKLKLEQMALLAKRDTEAYLQAQTTRWAVWSGVALGFALLAFTAWLVIDDLAARRRALAAGQEANAQLETRVRERTADLTRANERLTTENLERRWSAQALEHQLRYHELIVNSVGHPVIVLTMARNISRLNPALTRLTGWAPTDLINRPLTTLLRCTGPAGDFPPGAPDPIAQALKGGHELHDAPAVVTDRQGRILPVWLALFPLRDCDRVVGGVLTLRLPPTP